METGKDLINQVQGNIGEPSKQQSLLNPGDEDLVDYFFYKINITWGEGKYWQTFTDKETLTITKRDWAKDVLSALKIKKGGKETPDEFAFRAKSRVDRIFSEIRILSDDNVNRSWEWPSLKKITAYFHNYVVPQSHRHFNPNNAIEDQSKLAKNRKAGEKALAEMKKNMGIKS